MCGWVARTLVCSVMIVALPGVTAAQSADESDLALMYGEKGFVSIATGVPQAVRRAPAVATVITERDIREMGATQLEQVLESVPGLHVSTWSAPLNPIYSFRGIHTGYNPEVLMLVNGIPINNVFLGNRSEIWGGMPLENVARIEVIRGPGSALFGADAFAGVINVITKTSSDIKGVEAGARVGSFRSKEAWVQRGGRLGPFDSALYLGIGKTDGSRGIVEQDAQSAVDRQFGTSASHAPGPMNTVGQSIDARADLAYEKWRLRAALQDRMIGIGAGLGNSLDPDSRVKESRLYLDLSYRDTSWAPAWDVSALLGYFDVQEQPADPAFMLYPPGAFGGLFPNGVIGNPSHSERHTQGNVSAFYTGFDKHRVRIGTGFRVEDLYKANEVKNFTLTSIPGVGLAMVPLGGLVDVTNNPSMVYITPHSRTIEYAFVQDEWTVVKDWTLTAGLRYDHYSDFGGTTNPRLALVWDASYNFVVKAMYGRAFRAPSFGEQYEVNNPVTRGNPSLRPEMITTSELMATWQPTTKVQTSLSLFRYHMNDIIRFVPNADPTTGNMAENDGAQTGRGMELEATWEATRSLKLTGNVSLQRSIDEITGASAGLAPRRRIFARADWRFAPVWHFGTTVNYVAKRDRQAGDVRPPVPDYTTVDLVVRREKLAGTWEVTGTVLNLFNRDAREPCFAPGTIPFDIPLPRRAMYLQIQNTF